MLVISGVLFQVHDLLKGGAAKSTSEKNKTTYLFNCRNIAFVR
jgi:hypothetical protein